MGRKKDAQMLMLENKVKMLEVSLDGYLKIQERIQQKWEQSLIMMRDVYNTLIEGR